MPGYGLATVDPSDDDGEDKWDGPQLGTLVTHSATDKDKKRFDYSFLLNKKIYWKKYSEQDAMFFDNDLNQDVVFIKLEAIVGYDS